ncbi:Stage II sporulation protein D (SpoIID) [hydrothermal vent metagenome]|uniref:Stage II sporulation protein D (SpoIID) n=1 Tax=hydrothermal vent metagenome TaxID=652676 RepID=A0A3B0RLN1_9ZZZZ
MTKKKDFSLSAFFGLAFITLLTGFIFIGCAATSGSYGKTGKDKDLAKQTIRILVKEGKSGFKIDGAKGSSRLNLEYTGGKIVTLNGQLKKLPLRFHPKWRFIYIDKRPYRGVVEIREDKGALIVINELRLEDYIAGIINNEISSKWPLEAIKAQSVIARTYAIYQMEERKDNLFHMTGTHMDQVYTGAAVEDRASFRAVKKTIGEVLYYKGQPALTLYHSNAGGITEFARNVWGANEPYLRTVKSRHDKDAPNFRWELALSKVGMGEKLRAAGYDIGLPVKIKVRKRTKTGRVTALLIKDRKGRTLSMKGEDLRKVLGYATLRSTLFKVSRSRKGFVFKGRGSGHGVGLSQWGAKGMAEDGASYKKILRHYYAGTSIKKLY